jgi:hypothetical protein
MNSFLSACAVAILWLLTNALSSAAADDATLLRVFLRDGTSLVSYGEFAKVADRVVFSLPTSPAPNPALQLVNLPADRIDWDRTNKYAASARAARYAATQAEADYVALSNSVARTLDEVASATEPAQRLAIVEGARKTLAEWPQSHYSFRVAEVRQMLSMLDEAIADLRAAAGGSRFDLSLVTVAAPSESSVPLLPPPTPIESLEQLIAAAEASDSPVDRQTLLNVALVHLDRDTASLPRDWVTATRTKARTALEASLKIDRSYKAMTSGAIAQAQERARFGDVRGIRQILETLRRNDAALGGARPEAVIAAVAAVQAQLDAARSLQLAREHWAQREPVLKQYNTAMVPTLAIFRSLEGPLDDIKELAGSPPPTLASLQHQVARALMLLEQIMPPEECRAAHALLVSAAHLAENAAKIRREAATAGDIARAWDASSAAAGALMLAGKARTDIQTAVNRPRLQ